jgi:hypothetical protein
MGTLIEKGRRLFFRSVAAKAAWAPGLVFSDHLSTGEFCPLPLFPSLSLGARGFPNR